MMLATFFLSFLDIGATDFEGGWQGLSRFGQRVAITEPKSGKKLAG